MKRMRGFGERSNSLAWEGDLNDFKKIAGGRHGSCLPSLSALNIVERFVSRQRYQFSINPLKVSDNNFYISENTKILSVMWSLHLSLDSRVNPVQRNASESYFYMNVRNAHGILTFKWTKNYGSSISL